MKNFLTNLSINKNLSSNENTKNKTPWFAVSVFGCLFIWYFSTSIYHLVDTLFLPTPMMVIESFVKLFRYNNFGNDILVTTLRVVEAFITSICVAIPVSIFIHSNKNVKSVFLPYIDFFRYIPVPVLIPLTILFFGLGELSKISILFFGTIFQLILLFIQDLNNIPNEYYDISYTLNFSKNKLIETKLLSALPGFYDNARVSLGLCWSYVVIAELVSADSGIGHMIKESQRFSNTSNIYAAIITMSFIGFFSDFLLRRGYKYFFPYK